MQSRRCLTHLCLSLALAAGAAACNPEEDEGTFQQLEEEVKGAELGPGPD
jgi:hypothetical protein